MKYERILLKLSGEALLGQNDYGIDPDKLSHYAKEIKQITELGVQVAVVIGGGNIYRGINGKETGIEKVQGDYMGMLATVINGLAIQSTLELNEVHTRLISAIEMREIAEPYIRRKAIRHLEKGRVLIFCAGTGSPFFTTDSAAALRANEINADVILKATQVDGVYDADPEVVPTATRYDALSFEEAIQKNLQFMDQTAIQLCRENGRPIVVFDMSVPGNFLKVVGGSAAVAGRRCHHQARNGRRRE